MTATYPDLAGKITIITGGAQGIGKEVAGAFVDNGAVVIISDVREEQGKTTAAELGGNASFASSATSPTSSRLRRL